MVSRRFEGSGAATGGAVVGVLGLGLLALLVRGLGFEFVLVEGEVVFPPADPQYHLRRALYTFVNFPDVLWFDPYINFPGGAPVPWPPLLDFVVGGTAALLSDDVTVFERTAAFAAPVCGALAVIPIYLAGTLLGKRQYGFAAAFFFVWLPVAVSYGRLGNADHHAAVAMIGAWLLYACMGLSDTRAPLRRLLGFALVLGLARSALLLTWHGSLLYVGLADGLVLCAGVWSGRRALLGLQAASIGLSLAFVLPVVLVAPEPLGGVYSSIALSRLDVIALLVVAWVSLLVFALQSRHPESAVRTRVSAAVFGTVCVGVVLWAVPGISDGLAWALGFLTLSDGVGHVTAEQSPLFALSGRLPVEPGSLSWGLFVYLIPFAPAAAGWAALRPGATSSTRAAAATLLVWGAFFSLLTLSQRRYGNDFAPAAAVLFGFASVAGFEKLTRSLASRAGRLALSSAGVLGAVWLGFGPALEAIYIPRLSGSWAALSSNSLPRPDVTTSVAHTLHRFVRDVRRLTPETRGYLEPGVAPEYAVISPANLGHAIQYGARRATATDPFWWYIGPENWRRSFEFLESVSEAEAIARAEQLQARYLITSDELSVATVAGRLHRSDGSSLGDRSALGRFRLVTESLPGGLGLSAIFRSNRSGPAAYKLFELVQGARLEVSADPGTRAVAQLSVISSQGREFVYRNSAVAGADGLARLTLPYATGGEADGGAVPRTYAPAVYRVEVGNRNYALRVGEEDVQRGSVVRLDASAGH